MSSTQTIYAALVVIYDGFNPEMACCVSVLQKAKQMPAEIFELYVRMKIPFHCKECGRTWMKHPDSQLDRWIHILKRKVFHKVEDVPAGWIILQSEVV